MTPLKLNLEGMSCQGCVRAVTAGLKQLPGVTVDQVNVGSVALKYDPDKTTSTLIIEKLSELGFPSTIA